MSPHLIARLRIAMLLVAAILIQTAFGNDLRVVGVAPDLMVLLTICAGLTGGAESGAWVGSLPPPPSASPRSRIA